MAGPNLPTNRTTASTIAEHVADHNAAHNVVNKFDKDATSTTGDSLVWNGTVYVPSPRVLINVADYATPQLALDAAPAGAHIVFQSSYALSAALVVKADNQWIDARGASFTMSTWATPVFDAINRNGCTFDVGTVTYTGTRGAVGTAIRGENGYIFGCAVWINGDRNNVRSGRVIGMAGGAACFSPWNGTTLYGQQHVGNRLGVGGDIEVSGYNFGTLILWQKDFVIGNLYGHDDIDDSSGTNPTHVYYVQGDSTHRSSGLSIINARVINNLFGQPFQMKYADGVSIGNHSADASRGLANFMDCNDVTIDTMLGTNCLANGGAGALTLDFTTATCKRFRAGTISIQLAANVDERAASIWADDAEITNLTIEANHSAGVSTGLHLVVLRGDRGRIKSSTLRSVGAGHIRGFTAGFSATVVNNWTIDDPIVRGSRAILDVVGGSSAVKVRYDPRVQTFTGTATPVSVTGTPVGGELILNVTAPPDVQSFTASGTWTKPLGAVSVLVKMLGGGGGGGSGRRGAAATVRCGGGGGGGGGFSQMPLDASVLASSVTVTVGAAGTAGAAVTVDDTNGSNGGTGGNTTFGPVRAYGGIGGGGGTASAGSGGAGNIGTSMGGSGAAASGTGGAGASASSAAGGQGGAAGGGITSANAASNGGTGGTPFTQPITGNGGAGGVVDTTPPGAGGSYTAGQAAPGASGGGGAASITTVAQTGGAAGNYGAGGSGGGASLNGNNSGAGSAGSPGIVEITTYFQ